MDLQRRPLDAAFFAALDRRIARAIGRLGRPIRAVLSTLDGSKRAALAGIAGRADEPGADVEVAQHYGFASSPAAGAEVVAIPIGGSTGHLVVVAELDRAARPVDLADGEVCVYTAAGGEVRLKADGSVVVEAASGAKVELTAAGMVVLAGGAAGVARIGDAVTITGTDSNGGPIVATGIISAGSATVLAG